MAITYGTSNLGSSSNGGFAIYPVSTTGVEAVSVLKADFATDTVSEVTGAVPLTPLQTAALSSLLAELRSAVPAASTLALLRKLAGVLALTDSVSVALSVSSVGSVHTLLATPSAASKLLVYIPNSAAAGLYTGGGSDVSGGAPSGAAGGVLSGSYPNPSFANYALPYDFMIPRLIDAAPLGAGVVYGSFYLVRDVRFADVAEQQNWVCGAAPTANYIIAVLLIPLTGPTVVLGAITFLAGENTGTFVYNPSIDIPEGSPGDILGFIGQSPGDATFSGLTGTFKANANP